MYELKMERILKKNYNLPKRDYYKDVKSCIIQIITHKY